MYRIRRSTGDFLHLISHHLPSGLCLSACARPWGRWVDPFIGQYSQANEPCHHVIYLYTLAGRRDKAAERIRQVFEEFYKCEPGGLCGNDDCGQMSAWYIFSALGYYPVNPVGGKFVAGEAQVRPLRKLPWE